jgi:hypothetical protein
MPDPAYAVAMTGELIIGENRVIGLIVGFATPFMVLALGGIFSNPLLILLMFAALGGALLLVERLRSVGIGLLAGTVLTLAALLTFAALLSGAD